MPVSWMHVSSGSSSSFHRFHLCLLWSGHIQKHTQPVFQTLKFDADRPLSRSMTDTYHLHLRKYDITHHLIHGMIHGFTESASLLPCGRPHEVLGVNIRFWLKRMHALTCFLHSLLQRRDSHLPVSYGSFWRTFHLISPRAGLPTTLGQFPTYLLVFHRHLGGVRRFISSCTDLNLTTWQPDNLTASTLRYLWAKSHTTKDKPNSSQRDTSLKI